jgi:hypothetical protein
MFFYENVLLSNIWSIDFLFMIAGSLSAYTLFLVVYVKGFSFCHTKIIEKCGMG